MKAELTKEHEWLQKLVGEWEYEMESACNPEGEPKKCYGTETIRSLKGTWVVGEGLGDMGDGQPSITVITLGYDPQQGCFVGTWIGSMMTFLWHYKGELDPTEKILTLNSTGPSWTDPKTMQAYRDIIEFVDDNNRFLRSEAQQEDGTWKEFMRMPYRRKG